MQTSVLEEAKVADKIVCLVFQLLKKPKLWSKLIPETALKYSHQNSFFIIFVSVLSTNLFLQLEHHAEIPFHQ